MASRRGFRGRLVRLFQWVGGQGVKPRSAHNRGLGLGAIRLCGEPLEDRRLLSVGVLSAGSAPLTAQALLGDTTPPTVTSTTPDLTGGTAMAGLGTVKVNFSEPVTGAATAANYQLQGAGPDGLLGTADDVVSSLSASYAGTTATLSFTGLPEGIYRLTVKDTITDTSGNRLDGDANGTAGGPWVHDFSVVPPDAGLFPSVPTYPTGASSAYSVAKGAMAGSRSAAWITPPPCRTTRWPTAMPP